MLVVKVHTIGMFYVSGLTDQQVYGYTKYKGLIEYWKYDIRYGIYISIDHPTYSAVITRWKFISTETMRLEELSLLRVLLEGTLTNSQLLQESKIKGFDNVETTRYHGGGYQLSGGLSWDDIFLQKGLADMATAFQDLEALDK